MWTLSNITKVGSVSEVIKYAIGMWSFTVKNKVCMPHYWCLKGAQNQTLCTQVYMCILELKTVTKATQAWML